MTCTTLTPSSDSTSSVVSAVRVDMLKGFSPFQELLDETLEGVLDQIELLSLPCAFKLFDCGDCDNSEYFLVQGEVKFICEDGNTRTINAFDEIATRQLACLRPRQYTAVTTSVSEVIKINANVLKSLQQAELQHQADSLNYAVEEVGSIEEAESQDLLAHIHADLQCDRLLLHSLPEVNKAVLRVTQNPSSRVNEMTAALACDPAMAAKMIHRVNSDVYCCESLPDLLARLSLSSLRKDIVDFVDHDVFQTHSRQLKLRMLKAWKHSIEVAIIAEIIAEKVDSLAYPPRVVMLAGLVHDIGVIATLSYLAHRPDIYNDSVKLELIIDMVRDEACATILNHWQFSPDLVAAARNARHWTLEHDGDLNLCDLIQVAKLHSYLRYKVRPPLPSVEHLPAFNQLKILGVSSTFSAEILEQAQKRLQPVQQFMKGEPTAG